MRSVNEATLARDYREWAAEGLTERDWRKSYDAAKGWVARAGGAWTPEAWLVYAASGVFHGQPRIAIRSLDLALGNWVDAAPDRSVLLWARASITWRYLADPKTAELDLSAAARHAPDWLRRQLEQDQEGCREAAAVSRKRKPSVASAPAYADERVAHDSVAPPVAGHDPGSEPALWSLLLPILANDGPSAA